MKPNVTLTTDGAARGNPGPGGWAALLEAGGRERLLTGEEHAPTTNNAMELRAVIGGLEVLKKPCRVVLRADSQYVLGGLERLRSGGKLPEKNRPLWERLVAAAAPHEIVGEWVRGHSGDPRNERVNEAANSAATRAYAAAEQTRPTATNGGWTLALLSPAAKRPVHWALQTPSAERRGAVPVDQVTQPTAVYQALVQGLEAAARLPGAASASVTILSNYELIIKQGRGEWRVKNPDQQGLAAQVGALRQRFVAVEFVYGSTEQVRALVEK